jgi:hypothetical protein
LGDCVRIPEYCDIMTRGGVRSYGQEVAPFGTRAYRVGSGSPEIQPLEVEVMVDATNRELADWRGHELLTLFSSAQVVWFGAIKANQDLPFILGEDQLAFNKKRYVQGLISDLVTPSLRKGLYTFKFKFVTIENYWHDANGGMFIP